MDTTNPFDPAALRLDQSFTDGTAVKKLLTTIPVDKPGKHDWVRVHPDPAYRLSPVATIVLKADSETYLVTPAVAPELVGELVHSTIYTTINRQGVVRLWSIRLPDPDGKWNSWHRSAQDAADRAMRGWVRITSNQPLGAYEVSETSIKIPDPIWPDLPFTELLRIAFQGRLVDRLDHPLILQLRGLA